MIRRVKSLNHIILENVCMDYGLCVAIPSVPHPIPYSHTLTKLLAYARYYKTIVSNTTLAFAIHTVPIKADERAGANDRESTLTSRFHTFKRGTVSPSTGR